MVGSLKTAADAVPHRVVSGSPSVPGVVAIATDRSGNIYEGAAGKRVVGQDAEMTPDTVFAIFSTTKAITGTTCLRLVEDGKLDLDAPAKNDAPDYRQAAGPGRLRRPGQAEASAADHIPPSPDNPTDRPPRHEQPAW
jgi:CubicO group peptidase (beta-lactamase class C family)